MTNESLVVLIQSGEWERTGELWAGVERFVASQARKYARQLDGRGGVTWEDLYQSGFLAVVAAVDTYRPDHDASFIYWLAYHLKTAFLEATGNCGHQGKKQDALNNALDIDAPIPGTDDLTVGDTIEDHGAAEATESMETKVWAEQLHSALEVALEHLPAEQSEITRCRFYRGQTVADIAAEKGIPVELVQAAEEKAMRALRRPSGILYQLQVFMEDC